MNSHTPFKTTASTNIAPDGSTEFVWDDCEIFSFKHSDEGVWCSVYYHSDQDAIGHAFCSHSTRLWIV